MNGEAMESNNYDNTASAESAVGGLQGNTSDWRATLPADLQESMSKFRDVESLARSYREAQGLIGKKFEEFGRQDFETYKSMMSQITGVPVSPDGYAIDYAPQDGGEPMVPPELSSQVMELSHMLGLDNEGAQILHDACNEMAEMELNSELGEMYGLLENSMSELEADWGNAADSKFLAVNNAVENILPSLCGKSVAEIKSELMYGKVWASPAFMNILASIGEVGMETTSRGVNNMAPIDSKSRFNMMRNDPEFMRARRDPHHKMHEQAKREFADMCAAVNG